MFLKHLRTAAISFVLFSILTGLLYPLAITGIAQLIFPWQANGSLIKKDGKIVGSALIGQPFSDPKYFWSRPSATSPYQYNAGASAATNYGPLNPALNAEANQRISDLKKVDPSNTRPVPVDLVTSSGSGLDPDISIAAALYQLPRVASVRHMGVDEVRSLIYQCTDGRFLGFIGEPGVNVLKLNLALDQMHSK
ncbi:MAG: potassium-transporting ATPase subunit KdpC [Candidatus Kryptoniota bacterium]